MPKLRVLHVDTETGYSGGEVQVFLLMAGLRRRGHHIVLVCPPGSASEIHARREGFECRTIPMLSQIDLRAVVGLRREIVAARADLVHLHTGRANWLGGLAARAAGVAAVSTRRMDRRVISSARAHERCCSASGDLRRCTPCS
jgi:hypothetical protein